MVRVDIDMLMILLTAFMGAILLILDAGDWFVLIAHYIGNT